MFLEMLQRIEVQNNSYFSDFIFVQLHAVFTIIMFENIQYIKHIVDSVTKMIPLSCHVCCSIKTCIPFSDKERVPQVGIQLLLCRYYYINLYALFFI